MSRPRTDGIPTLSLIDRLSMSETGAAFDPPVSGGENASRAGDTGSYNYRPAPKGHYREAVRKYKDSVKRDLEWLFNTRHTFDERIDRYPQLSTSVYAYGLPDISSMNVASTKDQASLLRIMENSLATFDHRLKEIQIEFESSAAGGHRSLQFKINGIVLMDPAPEEILIDTMLDSSNDKFEVK